jgi:hypothetical protein
VLPIEITMPDGEIIAATTINISQVGVQLECGREDANCIFSVSEDEKTIGKPIELKTSIQLPVESTSSITLNILCRIVISRRMQEDVYQIGLKYIDINDEQTQLLDTHLQLLLESH